MKKVLSFILCCFILSGLSAQMVTKKTVALKDVDLLKYNALLLENNDKQFIEYLYPRTRGRKMLEHSLLVFDKKKRNVTRHGVVFKKPHILETAFATDKDYFAAFTRIEKKQTLYCTAHIPKKGTQNANAKTRLAIPSKKVWSTHVESPDGKLHGVILLADCKKKTSRVYVFVYDSTGKEVSFDVFTPSTHSRYYAFSKATLSNNGDMTFLFITYDMKGRNNQKGFTLPLSNALLFRSKDPKNTALHIVQFSSGSRNDYRIPQFSFGEIHSASILQLANGTWFIGGYYGPANSKPSEGYFSCIFDPNSESIIETNNYPFPEDQKPQDKRMVVLRLLYRAFVEDIVQLENGNIVMLGEQRAYVIQKTRVGNVTFTEYLNWASDIVYQTFSPSGENERSDMVRKLQSSNTTIYLAPETFCPKTFDFHDYLISFSHIVKGDDIYLVYNNSHETEGYCVPYPINYGKCCMRLAKLSPDGSVDYKVIMECENRKSYVRDVMLADDDGTVYISTSGKQGFGIESFTLDE